MLTNEDIKALDWEKTGGLIPAVVQDACSGRVLMLGCMNPEALEKTLETKKVTFWSRTKGRLWTKGETSGNWLHLVDIGTDCDSDALLVLVNPDGPTCHRGTPSCFSPVEHKWNFLRDLEVLLESRRNADPATSYTASLYAAAPSASRRRWAKRASRRRSPLPCTTGRNSGTRPPTSSITCSCSSPTRTSSSPT